MAFWENPDKEGAVVEQQANTAPPCQVLIFPVWQSEESQFQLSRGGLLRASADTILFPKTLPFVAPEPSLEDGSWSFSKGV